LDTATFEVFLELGELLDPQAAAKSASAANEINIVTESFRPELACPERVTIPPYLDNPTPSLTKQNAKY
jgi:hypothetical protein